MMSGQRFGLTYRQHLLIDAYGGTHAEQARALSLLSPALASRAWAVLATPRPEGATHA